MNLIVKAATVQNGKRGQYLRVEDPTGDYYYMFQTPERWAEFQPGANAKVEVRTSTDGKSRQIVSIEAITAPTAAPATSSTNGYSSRGYSPEKDRMIARQVALKAAIELLSAAIGAPGSSSIAWDEAVQMVPPAAEVFLEWLYEQPAPSNSKDEVPF